MELMFYALAPWLASLGVRFADTPLPVDYLLWAGRFFPSALFLFVFGMLAHRALPRVSKLPKLWGWIANALVLTMVVALPLSHIPGPIQRWIIYFAIAIAAPFLFNTFKSNRIDRWIGDISYPLYLCHLVIIGLVLTFTPNAPWAVWAATGGALAMSVLLLVLVDHPIDRWRQRRAKRAVEPAATLGVATAEL